MEESESQRSSGSTPSDLDFEFPVINSEIQIEQLEKFDKATRVIEVTRLLMLKQTQILESSQKDLEYDRYVNLTRRLFKTDVAMLSFLDISKSWIKSIAGGEASEFARNREETFCECTIAPTAPDVFVVLDAFADSRFHDNNYVLNPVSPISKLVTSENEGHPCRFYAGASLKIGTLNIGTLCIMDRHPRTTFSLEDRINLMDIAAAISQALEHLRLKQLRNKRERANLMLGLNHNLKTPLTSLMIATELLRGEMKRIMLDKSRTDFGVESTPPPSLTHTMLRGLETPPRRSLHDFKDLRHPGKSPKDILNISGDDYQFQRPTSREASGMTTPDNLPCMDFIHTLQGSVRQLGLLVEMGFSLGKINAAAAARGSGKAGFDSEAVPCDILKVFKKVQVLTDQFGKKQDVTWKLDKDRLSAGKCITFPDTLLFVLITTLCQVLPHSDTTHIRGTFVSGGANESNYSSGKGEKRATRNRTGNEKSMTRELMASLALTIAPLNSIALSDDGMLITYIHVTGDMINLREIAKSLTNTDYERFKTETTGEALTPSQPTPKSSDPNQEPSSDSDIISLDSEENFQGHAMFNLDVALKNVLGSCKYKETETGGVFAFCIPARMDKLSSFTRETHTIKEETTLESMENKTEKGTTKGAIRVLVVDDSLPVVKLLHSWFAKHGCETDKALNGLIALEMMQKKVYDIVCMDFLMPVMDGLTCMTQLQEWYKLNPVACEERKQQLMVGLSATAITSDINLAFEAGMHMFCPKPVNMNALATLLKIKSKGLTVEEVLDFAKNRKTISWGEEAEEEDGEEEETNLPIKKFSTSQNLHQQMEHMEEVVKAGGIFHYNKKVSTAVIEQSATVPCTPSSEYVPWNGPAKSVSLDDINSTTSTASTLDTAPSTPTTPSPSSSVKPPLKKKSSPTLGSLLEYFSFQATPKVHPT